MKTIIFVKGLLFYMLLLDLCLDIYLDFFSPSVASLIILWSKSWYVAFLLAACNCSVAGTKNATLPGVLYLDCLRDENTVPLRPGMVSALSVSIHNCLTMTWVGDVAVYYENSVLNSEKKKIEIRLGLLLCSY